MEGTVLYTSSNNYIMDSDLLTTLHGKKEIFFPQNLLYVKWIFLYISVEPGNIILFCCTYIPNFVCYVLLVLKVRKTGIWFTFLFFLASLNVNLKVNLYLASIYSFYSSYSKVFMYC